MSLRRAIPLAVLLFLCLACLSGNALATQPPSTASQAKPPTELPAAGPGSLPVASATVAEATPTVYLPTVMQTVEPLRRAFPDTWDGIHIFNDQLDAGMSDAQAAFVASHYAGTQKMTRSQADRLRSYNPAFVILHYRLGLGLGYRAIQDGCQPTGGWVQIIEGDNWVQEWPGDANVLESWYYHWPEVGGGRVLNCDWGWYLMNLDDPGWRAYWAGEVLRQLQANDDDGVFADSFSVPNYLGADHYVPALPEVDAAFESHWTARLAAFIQFTQQGQLGAYYFIPNAGSWVTTRDAVDYSAADGVMIEGLAGWGYGSYFELADWQLQMDRILGLARLDKIIIAQQYIDPADVNERMFILGSYLLVKGHYSYLNFEVDYPPEWFPEYAIPIGSPTGGMPQDIAALWHTSWNVYRRDYSNGFVLVNPTTATRTIQLGGTFYRANPNGGGLVPADGDISTWTVSYQAVTQITLPPNRAAVLLNSPP